MSLDPELEALLAKLPRKTEADYTVAAVRDEAFRGNPALRFPTEPIYKLRDRQMPGPFGETVPVRIYTPMAAKDNPRLPVLVFYHGGGWVIGDLDSHDSVCRHIAHHADLLVISVGYRLAPEFPFPDGLDDCFTATRWIFENAETLGGDPNRIAIGGDSAGGNLAAVVAQRFAFEGVHRPLLQWLAYPVTDISTEHPSMAELAEGYRLTRARMRFFAEHYVSSEEEKSDPEVSPLLLDLHPDIAPAYMQVAGYDPLRDEDIAYAEKLKAAGRPVDLVIYEGLIHGFLRLAGKSQAAMAALNDATEKLRTHLHAA